MVDAAVGTTHPSRTGVGGLPQGALLPFGVCILQSPSALTSTLAISWDAQPPAFHFSLQLGVSQTVVREMVQVPTTCTVLHGTGSAGREVSRQNPSAHLQLK